MRNARPYRVSSGAVLHIDDGDLVQRGDNLVLLVFERSKTGDIIQGLPRIEELLEARKPKEACILNRRPGVCQVVYEEGETVDIKVVEDDGTISDYPVAPNQNSVISDGQRVDVGDMLTDGIANPHEILEVFFSYYLEEKGCKIHLYMHFSFKIGLVNLLTKTLENDMAKMVDAFIDRAEDVYGKRVL